MSNVVNTSSIPSVLDPAVKALVEKSLGGQLSEQQCRFLGHQQHWARSMHLFEDNTPTGDEIRRAAKAAANALKLAHEALREFEGIEQKLRSTPRTSTAHRTISAMAMVFRSANDLFLDAKPNHPGLDFLRFDLTAALRAFEAVPAELIYEGGSGRETSYQPERKITIALAQVYSEVHGRLPAVSWNKAVGMYKGRALAFFEDCIPALLGPSKTIPKRRIGWLVSKELTRLRRIKSGPTEQAEIYPSGD
jgi:hypothetical protein